MRLKIDLAKEVIGRKMELKYMKARADNTHPILLHSETPQIPNKGGGELNARA
jgi:hypothetical protein